MQNPPDPRIPPEGAYYPMPAGPRAMIPAGGYPAYPPVPMAQDEDVIDLREYWRVLMRRRGTILTVAMIAVVAALIATFLTTPIYRADVLLQIEQESSRVVEFEEITPENTGDTKDFYQTQYELLRSRTLARRVIDQLGLRSSDTFAEDEQASFLSDLKAQVSGLISPAGENVEQDRGPDIEQLFLDNLTVSPVKNSRLVRVAFDSPDPAEAAAIANSLAENYVNTTLERRYDAASYAKTFLEERIEQSRANLEDSERRLLDYAREREIINLDDKLDILMTRLKDMSKEQVTAEAERIAAEADYQQLAKEGRGRTTEALESPVIQKLKDRQAELEAEYQDQLKVFKPGYPKMQRLSQQIAEIKRQIEAESSNIGSATRATYEAKVRQEAKLTATINAIKAEILALQDRSTDYQTLKREVDTNRELYDGLLQRMKEVGVVAGIGTNNISVVDAAEVPREKFKPSLSKNLAIALALGLFGGIALAFLLETLDDSVKSTDDVERRIDAPILGLVPWVSERQGPKNPEQLGLWVFEDPKSAMAEAYRSLRTSLIFATSEGAPRLMHFTSSAASEGKTTSACSTAITFAQTGSKVLLIDCDLRNPSLHKAFGLPNAKGLTHFLTGAADPADVAIASQVKRLFVIPSGPIPPHPVELLAGERMAELVKLARERFDFVILDGPPVLGLADAVVLANLARATIMVVESETTRAGALEGSAKRLRSAGANILGAVLVKHGKAGSGYGYDYHYSYSYGGTGTQQLPAESPS